MSRPVLAHLRYSVPKKQLDVIIKLCIKKFTFKPNPHTDTTDDLIFCEVSGLTIQGVNKNEIVFNSERTIL